MRKDLRDREALRRAPELAPLAGADAFDRLKLQDLRRLAELLRPAGGVDGVTIELSAAFGRGCRDRLGCARRALRALVGDDHAATRAVAAALSALQHTKRKGVHHRDYRTREAILHVAWWAPFRDLPGAATARMDALRAMDRYLAFCAERGLAGGEPATFMAFAEDKASSMLLRTLRDGLEHVLSPAHPVVIVAEAARSAKEAERTRRRRPQAPAAAAATRELQASVPFAELPAEWRRRLDRLSAGRRVQGRKYTPKMVDNMTGAARQLVFAARAAGLPDEISLDTIRAYDAALEARGTRPSSRSILFTSLLALGGVLRIEETLLDDLRDLVGYYDGEAAGRVKLKEGRLADLPDLVRIFDRAAALLDEADRTTDRRRRPTLYVDAAALAFLSLIPLRNADTVLRWGEHVTYIGDDDPTGHGMEDHPAPPGYRIDLRTSKTDEALAGPLAPILTPYLNALILQGRDGRFLPQLRREACDARAPVFPRANGGARSARGLSARWRAQLGTGSIVSRTRIHTLLGALGEHGVRAALALCAQRSPRTAKWYQAQALSARRMLESQEMIADLVELDDEDARLLAEL